MSTLPEGDLLPNLVRCRDLPRDADRSGLEDILEHFLAIIEIPGELRPPLLVALRQRLEAGNAVLMIDAAQWRQGFHRR